MHAYEDVPMSQWEMLPPEQKKVYVKCAVGFKSDAENGNNCVPEPSVLFDMTCKEATVSMKLLPNESHVCL